MKQNTSWKITYKYPNPVTLSLLLRKIKASGMAKMKTETAFLGKGFQTEHSGVRHYT